VKSANQLKSELTKRKFQMKLLRKLCEAALWLEPGQIRMAGPCGHVIDAYKAAPPPSL
jgi:ABC-type polysaccharide/polyol phosphate transport system ATPase subunit